MKYLDKKENQRLNICRRPKKYHAAKFNTTVFVNT